MEILLILFGAVIGFLSSIGTTIANDFLSRKGRVKIYYKIVFSKFAEGKTWGFHKESSGEIFEVPLWIELQNTSNSVRVTRDLLIMLFRNGEKIAEMMQMTNTNKNEQWYGDKGAYSFVLQPRSISKYDLHFLIKRGEMVGNEEFDEIRLRYFDEKDKEHVFTVGKIEQCWVIGDLPREKGWKLAKE